MIYYTKSELIRNLTETISLVEDRQRAEKLFNLRHDEFYPFMIGYLTAELKSVLETINYEK